MFDEHADPVQDPLGTDGALPHCINVDHTGSNDDEEANASFPDAGSAHPEVCEGLQERGQAPAFLFKLTRHIF